MGAAETGRQVETGTTGTTSTTGTTGTTGTRNILALVFIRLLAFLLIADSMFGALYVSGLLSQLGGYDWIAVALILARGMIGALQFIGGWLLANRRPTGFALARWGLIAGAIHTILALGLNLAPTNIYYWYRWHVTAGYCVYAGIANWFLHTRRLGLR